MSENFGNSFTLSFQLYPHINRSRTMNVMFTFIFRENGSNNFYPDISSLVEVDLNLLVLVNYILNEFCLHN